MKINSINNNYPNQKQQSFSATLSPRFKTGVKGFLTTKGHSFAEAEKLVNTLESDIADITLNGHPQPVADLSGDIADFGRKLSLALPDNSKGAYTYIDLGNLLADTNALGSLHASIRRLSISNNHKAL